MMIVLNCPGCKKRYELDSALAGKKSRCKQCGEVFRIPVPTARMIESSGPSPSAAPALGKLPPLRETAPLTGLLEGEPLPSRPVRPASRPIAAAPASVIPPRARPSVIDDSDDEIPRPIRTSYRRARRSLADEGDSEIGVTAFGWYTLFSGVALLLYYAFIGIFEPDIRLAYMVFGGGVIVLFGIGLLLCAWGNIWLVVVSFRDDVLQGLLCLFVPLYALIFILNRWSERRGVFALMSAPAVALLMNILMMLVVSFTTGGRLSGYPGIISSSDTPVPDASRVEVPPRFSPNMFPTPAPAPFPAPGPGFPRIAPRGGFAPAPQVSPPSAPIPTPRKPSPPDPDVPAGADAITRSLIELKSNDGWKRGRALERLQRSTPDGRVDQVVAMVLPMLEDDEMFRVVEAEKTLAVWRSPEARRGLIGRLIDTRPFVRSEAIKALGHYRDTTAAEAIVRVMKEDIFATDEALKAMGEVAEPALIPVLRSGDPDLRTRACRILAQVGGQATLLEMRSLPTDPDLGVRMAAQDAWKRIVARVGLPPRPARGTR